LTNLRPTTRNPKTWSARTASWSSWPGSWSRRAGSPFCEFKPERLPHNW